ncbi:single-stranded-DNA-specific exonuclease RecJ [Proteiniborus sp. MB09-C3]|uniref:single-stranded-DNA-specific exonuclease RecJ n=1 Tax=Proteiniborus sp. MB09-C3 TaxID=3050072 RepID=UPI0025545539|nr:single-stranded-DNA-specific exonuclease RecJ [Proteiniborus sp. MB09-C3]WIV10759.1 single-stranded-DNA-specific exonuclease RecJ [Proteiniborus sp. MB09-C3]
MIKFNSLIKVAEDNSIIVNKLSEALSISKLASKVMMNRGIIDINKAKDFLNPDIEGLLDPFLLKDMDIAVDRIVHAIHKNENIWIYGDYDVDGVTSTSILIIFLRTLCKNIEFYIPDRMSEGYGLNTEAIDYIKNKEGQLIISVDCGIQSFEVAEYCKKIGIDLIITDHHACGEKLPDAVAVINPNRIDNEYPFNKLAGVGVALKLIQALAFRLNTTINYESILPIVAIGTVADVVSLTGENRIIVKNGLNMIKSTDNHGVNALLEVTGLINKEVTSGHIGFVIGPRINATGRIGMAKYAVHLFITKDYEEAKYLAKMLDEENIKRQNIEIQILKEAEEIISKEIDLEKEKVLIIASENWHSGVIGIVSSRITEKYHRPSILISIEGEEGRGSARSISTFNLYENLNRCKDLFVKFGGHSQAAGLTIKKDNIEELRKRINDIADEILADADLIPQTIVDADIDIEEIVLKSAYELKSLEPFGIDNSSPSFLFRGASVKAIRPVGKDGKHLKLTMEKEGQCIDCIGFNFGRYLDILEVGQRIDLIASIDINDYLGQQCVQLIIKDIIISYAKLLTASEDYIVSLLPIIEESNKSLELNLEKLSIQYLNEYERIDYTINSIGENSNILIIVNNIFNLSKLLNKMQYEGREFIKRIGIAYNNPVEHNPCDIIINPILSRLDTTKYDKVIMYDMCFTQSYLMDMIGFFKNADFQVLVVDGDFFNNQHLIEDIMPKVDDIRLIYKTLITRKEAYLRIEIDKYLNSLFNKTRIDINRFKFITIVEILKGAKLLDYIIKDGFLIVKVLKKPDNKIDIANVSIYDKLCYISKEIINLKNNFNFLN